MTESIVEYKDVASLEEKEMFSNNLYIKSLGPDNAEIFYMENNKLLFSMHLYYKMLYVKYHFGGAQRLIKINSKKINIYSYILDMVSILQKADSLNRERVTTNFEKILISIAKKIDCKFIYGDSIVDYKNNELADKMFEGIQNECCYYHFVNSMKLPSNELDDLFAAVSFETSTDLLPAHFKADKNIRFA